MLPKDIQDSYLLGMGQDTETGKAIPKHANTTIQAKWKDSFVGSSLDLNKWDIIQTGAGQTITVSAGNLNIATGTTINSETIIRTKEVFTDPFRALLGFKLSQKIANQEFIIEAVSVDPNTMDVDGLNSCGWRFSYDDNATSDFAVYTTQNGGLAVLGSAAVDTNVSQTSASYGIYELELFADEVWYHAKAMDSATGRSYSAVRQQQIPDPNALFKIQIRVKNKGTAPASTSTFTAQFLTIVDYSELTVEVTAGRGNTAQGQGLAVTVANAITAQGTAAHDGTTLPNPMVAGAYAHNTLQAAVSADGDLVRLWADRNGRLAVWNPPVGAQANAWNNIAVSAAGTSTALDTLYCPRVAFFGNVSAATTLTVQVSQDNTNWYDSTYSLNIAAAGNFYFDGAIAARYLRLKSSAAATITATISGQS